MELPEIKTIEALEAEVKKVFLMVDDGIVALLCASVIANRMKLDPVWLMLIAASSGGKSELLNGLMGLKFVYPVSDLTVNSMASGFKGKPGEETSLLWKANYGILLFKDFTSILSKDKEAKKAIMAQFREIYDGRYDKTTGNGKNINWRGKIGAIAGATEMVYESLADMSAMGDRFIMYSMIQPPRLEVAKRMFQNNTDMTEKRQHIQNCFTAYITYVLENQSPEKVDLGEELQDEIIRVADFGTRARSAVLTDFKTGMVDFVPSPEMPMRVIAQLSNIATAFMIMKRARPDFAMERAENKDKLEPKFRNVLYKIAMDSIPKKRRMALQALASYSDGVSSGGLAALLNYPTETVRKWFFALNGLEICERLKSGGRNGDQWVMRDEYRKIMQEFDKIRIISGSLFEGNADDDFEGYLEGDDTAAALNAIEAREREEAAAHATEEDRESLL